MLASGRNFHWPFAPAQTGGSIDLTRPFARQGLGFIVSVLLNPRRQVQYIAALNEPHRLLMGYCFRRSDFPWVAIWEENQARAAAPWNGQLPNARARVRFNPLAGNATGGLRGFAPVRHANVFHRSGEREDDRELLSFLAQVPEDFGGVRDIQVAKNEILVQGSGRRSSVHLPATGLAGNGWE